VITPQQPASKHGPALLGLKAMDWSREGPHVHGRATEELGRTLGFSGNEAQQAQQATERSARNTETILYTGTAATRLMSGMSQRGKVTIDLAPRENYAAQDLLFPDRATFTFLTGLVVVDIESMCAVAGVCFAPSSDVLRISR
jgi:hypothetical protein